jgi:hypothetical protein
MDAVVRTQGRPMIRSLTTTVFSSLLALGLLGCEATKDLGATCAMTRPGDDGPEEIDESKVVDDRIDYLALGSAECDDLVCIRTSGSANPENELGKARGYCTASCIDDLDCEPDFEGKKTLVCEELLLDEAFLAALKENDPTTYEQIFGSGASARYCV